MFRLFGFFVVFAVVADSVLAECPDGYTPYLGPASDLVRNANGVCSKLCGAGITSLNTSNGYKFDLFATKNTSPALHVKSGSTICYADLLTGGGTETLNVNYNGDTYHANLSTGEVCPITYNLSFNCGEGATGMPPKTREIEWGNLIVGQYDVGTCYKPGYSHSGWKIDSTSIDLGHYTNYKYTTDKTMVAQWSANSYSGIVVCNYCLGTSMTNTKYVTGRYASNVTPPADPACTNPFNQELLGYDVLDVRGKSLGQRITPGVATQWRWPGNVRLQAVWGQDYSISTPAYYTLSFNCGEGATGTPPASRRIAYQELIAGQYDVGTCYKPGYSHSGWKIDSTSIDLGHYTNYKYTTDKTMVAQWSANSYSGVILCNNGTTRNSYISSKRFGVSVTPSATACTAPSGKTFAGYNIFDVRGNDTGDVVASGASFIWNYPYNLRLVAIWE